MRLPSPITCRIRNWAKRTADERPPDFVIGDPGDPYMRRWWIIPRNPLFNIYLHQVRKSDEDRALHDHPWWNMSIVLDGGYVEVTPAGSHVRHVGSVVGRRAAALHRLVVPEHYTVYGIEVWTLFITGPRIRTWGFQCPQGWVPWHKFVKPAAPGEVGRGCA